jgi:hypothetical protein
MASLKDLLSRTMLFTAARGADIDVFSSGRHAPSDVVSFPPPTSTPSTPAADRAVWSWKHDPASPAQFTHVSALVEAHGHAMPVLDKVEVESVTIKLEGNEFNLPLRQSHVLAQFSLASGRIPASSEGWWQLEANTDVSMVVVFGYEIVPASGVDPKPLDMKIVEKLGDKFFPKPDVPAGDPDYTPAGGGGAAEDAGAAIVAGVGQARTAYVAPPWIIVAVGLTTCKERADFEAGKVLGAGRIYPHVMVACNRVLERSEAKIVHQRPAKVMAHSEESLTDVGAIFMADTNESHATLTWSTFGGTPPFPLWSNFFDYYDLHPAHGEECMFVDPSKTEQRRVSNGIWRESPLRFGDNLYDKESTFLKLPGQGAFDNVHVAPRMKFENPKTGYKIPEIVMAPFCEHDCLHMHTRWGRPAHGFLDFPPKFVKGFVDRTPYAGEARPLVPSNQSVFVTSLSPSSFRYRALAAGPLPSGSWTVFNHHGSAYSLSISNPTKFAGGRFSVAASVIQLSEPYTRPIEIMIPFLDREIVDVEPMSSLAAFYYRLQFTGTSTPDKFMPRINILDLNLCRNA